MFGFYQFAFQPLCRILCTIYMGLVLRIVPTNIHLLFAILRAKKMVIKAHEEIAFSVENREHITKLSSITNERSLNMSLGYYIECAPLIGGIVSFLSK